MKMRFTSRLVLLLAILALMATAVSAQVTTSGRLTGVVSDANGALIPKAQVVAKHDETQTEYKTISNDEGGWTLPSIPNGTYTVTITAQGFKTTVAKEVKVDAGQVASLNTSLETGGATEQVVVTGGAEVLQTESSTVATTIVGRQIGELPFSTRDALQLVLTLPGVMTPGTPRTSSLNGLPKGSVNLTLDGANIQDNFLRSSDGFFTSIQAKSDAVQEVTVTTATPGAESGGEGAVQIRFITKSGSPEYHGGAFWQYRSKTFNSNYYFNNIDGLPRDAFILRQWGGNLGGPITIPKLLKSRDKVFFFVNYEYFTLPNAYASLTINGNELVLTNSARAGTFTYLDSVTNPNNPVVRQVNLLQLAASKGFPSTIDPTFANALALIEEAVHKDGALTSRIATNNDYNRLNYQFQDPGKNIRWFPTIRLDANVTAKHHLEFIHNYQHYFSLPDGVNGQLNVYPGTGIVLGNPGQTGSIHRNTFSFVGAHRWTISDRLVNEVRATSSGNGTSLFFQEFAPGFYHLFDGFSPSVPYIYGFVNRSTQSRRNTPVKGLSDNLTMLRGPHTLNLGFAYTRVASFTQGVGSQIVPRSVVGYATGDPANSGGSNMFVTANFPGASAAQRTDAANLYALLTARLSSITRSASLNANTRAYEFAPFSEYNHQNEYAFYVQDAWKARPNLTFNYGLRWELEPSAVNDNNVYTRTSIDGLFGVSGTGNLFKPGVFAGKPTQFTFLGENEKAFRTRHKDFGPSFGFAWSPNFSNGLLGKIVGKGDQTVVRGGYSIAYTREGFSAFNSMFGSNPGGTVSLSVSPNICAPPSAGAPSPCTPAWPLSNAGVLFRDRPNLPFLTPPKDTSAFPLTPGFLSNNSANDFDPALKAGYTQSFSFGIQRELDKNTAVEARFVSTHGTHLWRQMEYNEVNIFENGFLDVFKAAQNNLAIFMRANPLCGQTGQVACNYGNSGLAGQVAVPLITTAIGGSGAATDSATITSLLRGEAGRVANAIAFSAARMNNLMNANGGVGIIPFILLPNGQKISNFFIVNPQVAGGTFVMTNGINTTFNALQIELRRRLANGLLVQGSYQFGKALSNSYSSSDSVFSNPRTQRRPDLDKTASPWDIRHAFKIDWIYELPLGPGKPFLSSNNPILSRVVGGWQFGGVARLQSGPAILFTSGRLTFNQNDAGVVLHNISTKQLQNLLKIRKTTVCDPNCHGVVLYFPDSFIKNTKAAFENGGTLDPNAPYLGPPNTPGVLGDRLVLYGPNFMRFDLNLMKRIRITERTNFEGRVQFLNAFNRPNFFVGSIGSVNSPLRTISGGATDFGETRAAYRDPTVSGTNDPGGRLIEFQLRLNF